MINIFHLISGGEGDSVYRLNRKYNTLVELFTDMDLYGIVSMDVVGNTFYMGTWTSGVFRWEQKTGLTKLGLDHITTSGYYLQIVRM